MTRDAVLAEDFFLSGLVKYWELGVEERSGSNNGVQDEGKAQGFKVSSGGGVARKDCLWTRMRRICNIRGKDTYRLMRYPR